MSRDSQSRLLQVTRRHLFQQCGVGLGSIALSQLVAEEAGAAPAKSRAARPAPEPLAPKQTHFPARAKRVIYLHMAGGPSQLDLFDPKPKLRELHGQVTPKSLLEGKRFAFLKPDAKLLGSPREFKRYGRCGAEVSDLLPHLAGIVDDLCIVRTMATDVFNHGPAKMFIQSGAPQPGRPAIGSWLTYGIGSESRDLPGFVVLQSGPRGPRGGAVLWSSGFLPTTYQGVPFLPGATPIVDLASPRGFNPTRQRDFIDALGDLNRTRLRTIGDPEIATRIAAYEMAYRMQLSAPELMDLRQEDPKTLESYGAQPGKHSFANNCLLARRLVERGVRFVQLYHTDWDHHGGPNMDLETHFPTICREVDQPCAALVRDLKQRGLLDDTIVIWGGEFGRTPMGEARETTGRDHHIEAFTMWMAGGGFKAGAVIGSTDELGYNPVDERVHVHDLHATLLHLLGLDHKRLTYRFQGRDFRLTDVHGNVVQKLLA
ncbi:MAG: DUF1501 domain-containing protein [Armatimonadota bacterium]